MSDSNIIQTIRSGKEGQIQTAVYSIIGHREYQQDFAGLVVEEEQALAVVCDGMGGLTGGEAASRESVSLLIEDYIQENPKSSFSEFLCREASRMDMRVHGLTTARGEPLNAGSTAAAVIVSGGQLFWMSVGDSRIYVLRGDSIAAVTRDHNYRLELSEALERGDISMERFQAECSTRKAEALTSYLGMGGLRRMERNGQPFTLEDKDIILLCSDGLYKSLDEHQIQAMILDNQASLSVAARRLVRMALQLAVKSQDNTTVILLRYHAPQGEEKEEYGALL